MTLMIIIDAAYADTQFCTQHKMSWIPAARTWYQCSKTNN